MRTITRLSAIALCAAILTAPAAAATLNIGGNGGGILGTGLLSGGSGSSTGTSANVNVNTGTGGSGGLLGLSGDGQTATVDANLGDGTQGNVLVDLFGNGGTTGNAQVGLGVGGLGGEDAVGGGDVTLDLFGNGTGGGVVPGGGTIQGGGSGGTGGTGGTVAGSGGISVASVDSSVGVGCFSPNAAQLSKLANRHDYVATTFSGWNGATVVKVIDAGVCPAAVSSIASQPNIGRLQAYISASPTLRSQLAQWGHAPGDVIAVDRQGKTLIFYVA